ncbi:uncharacterized protein LOC124183446 [Neodiprion fabricii]|uniref:uncharacterized protein LOC124183446 n=1 Tax=Neodiprion fabricii TaxID=2872261 RepID=UPI001ED96EDB|nr:uncharacterized protein LOC124183446 [Neodiprion fabricii]
MTKNNSGSWTTVLPEVKNGGKSTDVSFFISFHLISRLRRTNRLQNDADIWMARFYPRMPLAASVDDEPGDENWERILCGNENYADGESAAVEKSIPSKGKRRRTKRRRLRSVKGEIWSIVHLGISLSEPLSLAEICASARITYVHLPPFKIILGTRRSSGQEA